MNYGLQIQWFLDWFRRPPDAASSPEVKDYLLWQMDLGRSASSIRQAKAALVVLYQDMVGQPEVVRDLPSAKTPKTLPVVLSKAEVRRLLNVAEDL